MTFPVVRTRRRRSLAFSYAAGQWLAGLNATFSRGSTATYLDSNGVRQTALSGVARDGHYIGGVQSLLLEGQRSDHFVQSGTPATQTSPSLTTGTYTLWIEGPGSIAVAGTTATITGAGSATAGTPKTFVVTVAGTVTYTVTGSPTLADVENGAFATSYIPTTTGTVTRSGDSLNFPWAYVPQATTLYTAFVEQGTGYTSSGRLLAISNAGRTGAYLEIVSNNTGDGAYFISHNNGSSGVTKSSGAGGAIGQLVEVRAVLNTDGSVFLGIAVNGGAETVSTTSATNALAATWASGAPLLWVNGQTALAGFAAFRSVKVANSVQSLASMRAA